MTLAPDHPHRVRQERLLEILREAEQAILAAHRAELEAELHLRLVAYARELDGQTPPIVPVTKNYCAFRSRRNCDGPPVTAIVKTRVRHGKVEQFVYNLCPHHAKVAKR